MQTLKVKHLMTDKLVTLFVEETLPLAEDIMKLRHIRHLPVVNDEGRLEGLVSHRDILAAQISVLAGLTNKERAQLQAKVKVGDIMQTGIVTAVPDESVLDAAMRMADLKLGCLPVVDVDRRLVGILTEADLLRLVIRYLERDAH
jgi:CBS domain-containing protein